MKFYLKVFCREFSTDSAIDLKKPWTAEQAYVIVETSREDGVGEGSCDLVAESCSATFSGEDTAFRTAMISGMHALSTAMDTDNNCYHCYPVH